jgi:hypothetical protein
MKNLQEATEMICDLKGSLVALDALVTTLIDGLPQAMRDQLQGAFRGHAEVARTVLLHTPISEHTIAAFERDVRRLDTLISASSAANQP